MKAPVEGKKNIIRWPNSSWWWKWESLSFHLRRHQVRAGCWQHVCSKGRLRRHFSRHGKKLCFGMCFCLYPYFIYQVFLMKVYNCNCIHGQHFHFLFLSCIICIIFFSYCHCHYQVMELQPLINTITAQRKRLTYILVKMKLQEIFCTEAALRNISK